MPLTEAAQLDGNRDESVRLAWTGLGSASGESTTLRRCRRAQTRGAAPPSCPCRSQPQNWADGVRGTDGAALDCRRDCTNQVAGQGCGRKCTNQYERKRTPAGSEPPGFEPTGFEPAHEDARGRRL